MHTKEHIEQEIEKTLQCFDSIEQIQPRPFFFTRLKARIAASEAEEISPARFSKWGGIRSVLFAVISLLIILNLAAVLTGLHKADYQGELRKKNLVTFAEEYALLQEREEDLFAFLN